MAQGLSTRETSPELVKIAQEYRTHDDPKVRQMAMSLISQAEPSFERPDSSRQQFKEIADQLRREGQVSLAAWELIEQYDQAMAYKDHHLNQSDLVIRRLQGIIETPNPKQDGDTTNDTESEPST